MTTPKPPRITKATPLATLAMACTIAFVSPANAQVCDPTPITKLLATDGAQRDRFGWEIDIDADTAIISAYLDNDNGFDSGSAYIYTRDANGQWSQTQKLTAIDGQPQEFFGYSVAIDGDIAAVGALLATDNAIQSGAVYIYTRTGNTWNFDTKLVPANPEDLDHFGFKVAIDGQTLVVASDNDDTINGEDSGSVYIYTRDAGTWSLETQLLPADGDPADFFATAIDIQADTLAVGTPNDDDRATDAGAVYVYTRDAGIWSFEAKLLASDAADGDWLGISLAIDNNTIVAGATKRDNNGEDSGAAYVFTRTGTTWFTEATLLAFDGAPNDRFGVSVAVEADTVVVGAPRADETGVDSGAVYAYTRYDGIWAHQPKALADDLGPDDRFGRSVAYDNGTLLVGAYFEDQLGINAGSTYAFDLGCAPCPPDLNHDAALNFFDVSAFLAAFSAQDPIADFNSDGSFNFFDVSAFLTAFAAGCP